MQTTGRVSIICSFHDGIEASVREGSGKSPPFGVTSGTKQGCVLAPTLFSIFFSMMLLVAFKDTSDGVDIKSRCDVGIDQCRKSLLSVWPLVIQFLLIICLCSLFIINRECVYTLTFIQL